MFICFIFEHAVSFHGVMRSLLTVKNDFYGIIIDKVCISEEIDNHFQINNIFAAPWKRQLCEVDLMKEKLTRKYALVFIRLWPFYLLETFF